MIVDFLRKSATSDVFHRFFRHIDTAMMISKNVKCIFWKENYFIHPWTVSQLDSETFSMLK